MSFLLCADCNVEQYVPNEAKQFVCKDCGAENMVMTLHINVPIKVDKSMMSRKLYGIGEPEK